MSIMVQPISGEYDWIGYSWFDQLVENKIKFAPSTFEYLLQKI